MNNNNKNSINKFTQQNGKKPVEIQNFGFKPGQ